VSIHSTLPTKFSHLFAVGGATTNPDIHQALNYQANRLGADRATRSKLGSLKVGQHTTLLAHRPPSADVYEQYQDNSIIIAASTFRKLQLLYAHAVDANTQRGIISEARINHEKLVKLGAHHEIKHDRLTTIIDALDEHSALFFKLAQNSPHDDIRELADQAFDHAQNTAYENAVFNLERLKHSFASTDDIDKQLKIIFDTTVNHDLLVKLGMRNGHNEDALDTIVAAMGAHSRFLRNVSAHSQDIEVREAAIDASSRLDPPNEYGEYPKLAYSILSRDGDDTITSSQIGWALKFLNADPTRLIGGGYLPAESALPHLSA
jgi:hypothetical protein